MGVPALIIAAGPIERSFAIGQAISITLSVASCAWDLFVIFAVGPVARAFA